MDDLNRFLADGYWRAHEGSEPIIRSEVEHEFSDRLRISVSRRGKTHMRENGD